MKHQLLNLGFGASLGKRVWPHNFAQFSYRSTFTGKNKNSFRKVRKDENIGHNV